jgi:hypothetical protein
MLNISYEQMVVLSNASRSAWQTLLNAIVPVNGYIYQAVGALQAGDATFSRCA